MAVTYRDGVPAHRQSPIQVLTGPDVPNDVTTTLNHLTNLTILVKLLSCNLYKFIVQFSSAYVKCISRLIASILP